VIADSAPDGSTEVDFDDEAVSHKFLITELELIEADI